MMLSPHFALAEFTASETAARRGIDNTPSPAIIEHLKMTAELLEDVRVILRAPILITSGYRCTALNAAIGGAANSAHIEGRAADFICPGFGDPLAVCRRLSGTPGIDFDQLIYEFGDWTHIAWADDCRMQCLTINSSGTRFGITSEVA